MVNPFPTLSLLLKAFDQLYKSIFQSIGKRIQFLKITFTQLFG